MHLEVDAHSTEVPHIKAINLDSTAQTTREAIHQITTKGRYQALGGTFHHGLGSSSNLGSRNTYNFGQRSYHNNSYSNERSYFQPSWDCHYK